jgi:uncharacterized membrane protein YdfJ with MMPL/SSD domain
MKSTTTISQMLVRTAGVIQIGLGLLFWTNNALDLIPVHMLVGFVVVLCLWLLAGLAARSGVQPVLVAFAIAWGVVVPVFGMTQTQILPGSFHWMVQVLHLLVGVGALALAETLARRIRSRLAFPRATAQPAASYR